MLDSNLMVIARADAAMFCYTNADPFPPLLSMVHSLALADLLRDAGTLIQVLHVLHSTYYIPPSFQFSLVAFGYVSVDTSKRGAAALHSYKKTSAAGLAAVTTSRLPPECLAELVIFQLNLCEWCLHTILFLFLFLCN